MTKRLAALAVVSAVVSLADRPLFAQSFTATLVGTVTDPSGAALPGATVTAVQQGTARAHTALTASDGGFTVPQLAPGRYDVTVEMSGFKRHQASGLVLETDQTRRLDVRLEVGGFAEAITVSGEAPLLNTDTSSKGEVITQRQVQDLPLNGRNYAELALLVPGVYRRPAEDDQGEGLATAGTRTDASNFILDGVVNRSDRNASPGVNAAIDAIEEFKVETSTYSAEYGRTAGAQVNVVSKSGSNRFSGSAYEYLRDDVFDAQNFFTAPGEQKSLRRHQFGATVGGPVVRDKTFFFASYEGTRERRSESALTLAPNEAWLRGDFRNVRGAGPDGILGNADDTNRILDPFTRQEFPVPNVIPESMFHPITRQLLPMLPAANRPGTLDGYATTGLARQSRTKLTLKLDHRFSRANNAFLRWARESGDGYDPFPSARNFYPGFGRDTTRRLDSFALSDTHVFSAGLVNEARVGLYDQKNQNLGEHRDVDWIAKLGIGGLEPTPDLQGFPAIRIDGFSEFGDRPNDPFIYDIQNLQFFDMATRVSGRHNLRVGVDFIRSNYVERDVRNVRGDFRFRGRNTNPTGATSTGFRSFADFLLGLPDATQRQIGADPADLTGWQYAVFVQDDWRVRPWLTLNLGLRYELQAPLTEAGGRIANFIPELGEVVKSGDPRYPKSLLRTDKNNLGPRVGFAARPFGSERTVVRGGAGIYYSLETFNPIRQQLAVTYPFVVREQYSRVASDPGLLTMSNPFPAGRGGLQGVNTPFGLQVDYRTPEFYQYNLTVERELLRDLSVEVGYVGSQGRYLGRRFDINQPLPVGLGATGNVITARRFPQFSDTQFQEQTASSSFNALQASLRRRSRGGLTLLVSYTFSRAVDDASSTNNSTTGTQKFPQDIRNLGAERSLSDFHRAHQFSASFNYELPVGHGRRFGSGFSGWRQAALGGWQLNGIVTVLSGRPYTPQYSAPDVAQQRPDLVGDPNASVPADLWFNPAAFARPVATAQDPDLFGNAGRNILIGPSFQNVDLSLFKTFRVRGRARLQFRTEVFNALNHPNFQVPVFLLDRSDVGQVTSTANEGREFQFALKLLF
jgi:Carboxypeptidase regulatory-like domain/TonB-dependent Receptor Plug Domain